jgi:hypothetical protein
MRNKRKGKVGKVGSSFDGSLAEQAILEECEEQAIKQILANQIKAALEKDRLTRQQWRSVCKPAVERSIVCSIPPTRALHCTLFNALLLLSAVNFGWNLSDYQPSRKPLPLSHRF